MDVKQRIRRRNSFERFTKIFDCLISNASARDPRHENREKYCGFSVCPKGREGGNDSTIAEAFYGRRPLRGLMETKFKNGQIQETRRIVDEQGATLAYQLHENGYMSCTIYPCQSENYKPIESFIILHFYIDPSQIMLPWKIYGSTEQHFRCLSSYFEVTSVDGVPTTMDRLRIWWLRFTRTLVVRNEVQRRGIVIAGEKALLYGSTVGLSGFILFLVEKYLGS